METETSQIRLLFRRECSHSRGTAGRAAISRSSCGHTRLAVVLATVLTVACCRPVAAAPQIGYAYPAGGQRGTTFTVEVGGQSLQHVDAVRVSGRGVRAAVVEYARPLDNNERGRTQRFLRELVRRRWNASVMDRVARETREPPLPDHPWLRDIDQKSPNELDLLRTRLFDPKKQPNAQIREQAVIEVTIDRDAQTGDRELRLASHEGLSNPLCFQVGTLPEVCEKTFTGGRAAPVLDPPMLLNGQVTPGEVDHVHLRLRSGQKLVISLQARRLIPYLADAVPGWFQAIMTLHDSSGNEVAWSDDYRFSPDPVILYEVPANGVYTLEVRDAIYRGRNDFVYRIAVGQLPFVAEVFPMGGPTATAVAASIRGWNLTTETLQLDTRPGPVAVRQISLGPGDGPCNDVRYAVSTLPEVTETEPNNADAKAHEVAFPVVVNGRIGQPGDVDIFGFQGRTGREIVVEVFARRLHSPLDSYLRLTDSMGKDLAVNDDHKDREMGLLTHQADSYVRVRLPRDGRYLVFLSDAQRRGGSTHAYRLQLRNAQPDFALRLVPSCINVPPGGTSKVTVHALRKDGFDGEIKLALADTPDGFTLSSTQVPAGQESVEAQFRAPRGAHRQVLPLRIDGQAEIGGVQVSHPAIPAEDMMQAFLWRFLVPRRELLAAVRGPRPIPAVWRPLATGFQVAYTTPVRIPLGGTAKVAIKAPQALPGNEGTALSSVRYRLCNRPRGVTLRQATAGPTGVELTFKADPNTALAGDAANVIVEAFAKRTAENATGPSTDRGIPVELGVLPAIAYEIVKP